MDISKSRERPVEQERIADLLELASKGRSSVLDIGARDGYISRLLTSSFQQVVALDLDTSDIQHERITCVIGDVTNLQFSDNQFNTVVCAEVLEHIPSDCLQRACDEIARVARDNVIIGVPYREDTRVGRTTCYSCGRKNPPWGHVNAFDEKRLKKLFPNLRVERFSYVGTKRSRTNPLSALLMDLAGNPYGTYDQEEGCVSCGANLKSPPQRTLMKRSVTVIAFLLQRIQESFLSPQPNWIHVHFRKGAESSD